MATNWKDIAQKQKRQCMGNLNGKTRHELTARYCIVANNHTMGRRENDQSRATDFDAELRLAFDHAATTITTKPGPRRGGDPITPPLLRFSCQPLLSPAQVSDTSKPENERRSALRYTAASHTNSAVQLRFAAYNFHETRRCWDWENSELLNLTT